MEPRNPWMTGNPLTKNNSSDTNNNGTSNNAITPSHLLASNYVPNNLRAINTASVSAYIQTKPPPSMEQDIERVFCGLGGSCASTSNTQNDHYTHPAAAAKMNEYNKRHTEQANIFNLRPKAIQTIDEASFVATQVRRRQITFASNRPPFDAAASGSDDRAAEAEAKKIPSIGKDMVPGGRDEVGTTQHYLAVFRELLQVEHAEIQRLYRDLYNEYKIRITTPQSKSTKGGKVNNGVGDFRMTGVADGRPSIRPGDTVLVRPYGPMYLPLDPNYNGGNGAYNMSHPRQPMILHQRVEVVARVLAVNRGKISKEGKVRDDQVLISWVEDPLLHLNLRKQTCTVRFVPSSATHERCLTALNWLRTIDPAVARDLLFPSTTPKLPPPPAIEESNIDVDSTEEREYEQLNTNQARFVQMVTTRTAHPTKERVRPPMVLTGPAGTGKTKTLLATILQILRMDQNQQMLRRQEQHNEKDFEAPRSRILICTPSHTACDVITERLVNLLAKEQRNNPNDGNENEQRSGLRKVVYRLYDATRQVESVPVQILPYTRQRGDGGEFAMPDTQELLGFSVIVCTCQDAHLLFLAGLTNSSLRQRRTLLKSDVERRLRESGLELRGTIEGCNSPHFTHLFIDEAAQATEPECLIPLSVVVDDDPDAIKVEIALCGDPRQLGPCVYSPDAMEGLQRSLLERLLRLPVDTYGGGRDHLMGPPTADSRLTLDEMIEYSFQKTNYRQHLSVFLNLSYRGHPSFLYMPSKLFYFDKLKSICRNDSDDKWMKAIRKIESGLKIAYPETLPSKQMDWPIMFRGVKGECKSVAIDTFFGSNCWCNRAEANAVVEIIEKVIDEGISTASIGVMAAFRAQVVLIRKLLRAKDLGSVNVGMVEDYQSMEREIIILSLTRSNKSLVHADVTSGEGLFYQAKRMNVALTRAERMLVVVGEPNLMSDDDAWAQWLGFCKDNGLWYGETGENYEL